MFICPPSTDHDLCFSLDYQLMNTTLTSYLRMRLMQTYDLPIVMEIETAAYPFPWSLQNFQDCLQVGYRAKVLELDDIIVGYGLMSIGAGEANILNICVHPHHRRTGYGRRILKHLLALAKQEEVTTVFLEVRISNHAAIQLYRHTGFNQVGIRKGYYTTGLHNKEDGLVLALSLSGLKLTT